MASNDASSRRLLALCTSNTRRTLLPLADTAHLLIDQGANVNQTNKHGTSLLSVAAMNGDINTVKTLLAAEGINIRAKTHLQYTAFMYACMGAHIEVARTLLQYFDINDTNIAKQTTLLFCCMYNKNVQIVKFLLSIPRANIYLKCTRGITAFDIVKEGTADEDEELRALFQGKAGSKFLPFCLHSAS
jgi:ankyrin repeat protein